MKNLLLITFLLSTMAATAQDVKIQGPKKPQSSNAGNRKRTNNVNSETNKKKILSELANNMVFVEGGTYMMGNNYEGEQFKSIPPDDYPAHSVTVNSFYICKYEVTQELWQAVMGQNPSGSWGNTQSQVKGSKKPVVNVSRNDCNEFISKLNMLTGKLYRLPKETEWEFAARGGKKSKGYKYSGSNSLNKVAWFQDNSGSMLHEVGQKEPNELGLYDMSGNASEWCSDSWYYYKDLNWYNHHFGIYRGGGWRSSEWENEVTCRKQHLSPDNKAFNSIGLRLVMSPEDQ